jgi:hypothetical protein
MRDYWEIQVWKNMLPSEYDCSLFLSFHIIFLSFSTFHKALAEFAFGSGIVMQMTI